MPAPESEASFASNVPWPPGCSQAIAPQRKSSWGEFMCNFVILRDSPSVSISGSFRVNFKLCSKGITLGNTCRKHERERRKNSCDVVLNHAGMLGISGWKPLMLVWCWACTPMVRGSLPPCLTMTFVCLCSLLQTHVAACLTVPCWMLCFLLLHARFGFWFGQL